MYQGQKRKFKGIWIEAEMWLTKDLTITEKVLLAEIDSFESCFASNEYLGTFLDRTPKYVSDLISKLVKRGFLERSIFYKVGSKEVDYRILKVPDPLPMKKDTPSRSKRIPPPDIKGDPLPMNPEDITKTYNKAYNKEISSSKLNDDDIFLLEFEKIKKLNTWSNRRHSNFLDYNQKELDVFRNQKEKIERPADILAVQHQLDHLKITRHDYRTHCLENSAECIAQLLIMNAKYPGYTSSKSGCFLTFMGLVAPKYVAN